MLLSTILLQAAAVSWGPIAGALGAAIAALAFMSLFMVAPIKMYSLKFHNFGFRENYKRYLIIFSAIAFVIFLGVSGLTWTIVIYILLSMFSRKHI